MSLLDPSQQPDCSPSHEHFASQSSHSSTTRLDENMSDHESPSESHSGPPRPDSLGRSDSSASAGSDNEITIHQPIPTRPRLPSRKSSGPLVVPRDSSAVGPIDAHFGPDDVRAMSPRRTSEDIDKMGRQAREELTK